MPQIRVNIHVCVCVTHLVVGHNENAMADLRVKSQLGSGTRIDKKARLRLIHTQHAVPLPCRALIHTCHAAPLPRSDSAVSFVNVRMVAGNSRLLVQQCNRSSCL